ncbi:MAG TPA: photosynthesis system II assembly factor Ycf48 [Thermosynechococcaceae cyanobacterium]
MSLATKFFKRVLTLVSIALLCAGCANAYLPSTGAGLWEAISLPTEATLLDIGFAETPQHGWLVGTNSTLMETEDGGKNWQPQKLELDQNYRFSSVSFDGKEGWIVGQPSILLHTTDAGKSWSRVPLSEKLPGAPNTVLALKPQSAEMTTTIGAIYRTVDGGKNWKAMVEEAVGVIRNISRSKDGKYVAVSSRGNFYSIWAPGMEAWEPHNRNSSRRLQNMGFTADGRLWLLARGGQLQFSDVTEADAWSDPINPEFATSWGLLDLAYRTPDEIWVAGGSGNLLRSVDAGKTWEKERGVENFPSNLYKIVFINPEEGFILGQRGNLLRYTGSAQSA